MNFLKLPVYLKEKIVASIPLCFLTINQSQSEMIFGVAAIVVLDTILGIWVSIKYKIFSSHGLSRIFEKISRYAIALASVWIISAIEPTLFGWAFRLVGLFIILTEIISNFEKLALLGFSIPSKMLGKLNDKFFELLDAAPEQKKQIGTEILENRERKC